MDDLQEKTITHGKIISIQANFIMQLHAYNANLSEP